MIYRGPQMQDTVLKPLPTTALVALRSASLAKWPMIGIARFFKCCSATGAVYQYVTLPIQAYYDLLRADSKGSYSNLHIRSCYPHDALRSTPLDSLPV
jgi:KTSC domain-containing protein